ncbi:MAG: hypothetical protein QM762_22930 [Chryseolinea sp.]
MAQVAPISLHPENPHYFKYQGKPLILITSGEHYGAVVNLDFNFSKYLDELSSKKLNLTRVFTGAYIEPVGAFNIERNNLAPAPDRFSCPWKRSAERVSWAAVTNLISHHGTTSTSSDSNVSCAKLRNEISLLS